MLFFSLVFVLLKLKINFGRVTRGYVLAKKKQFSLGSEWKVSDHWGRGDHGTEMGWFFKNRPVYHLVKFGLLLPRVAKSTSLS